MLTLQYPRAKDTDWATLTARLLTESGFDDVADECRPAGGIDGNVKLLNPLTMENIAVLDGLASRAEIDQIIADQLNRSTRSQ